MPSKDKTLYLAKPSLLAASASLTVFWMLNIFKESYVPVKNTLNFYKPVGPLLGLFLVGIIVYVAGIYLFKRGLDKKLSDKAVFGLYSASAIIFFVMVFPPFFQPIVEVLAGK